MSKTLEFIKKSSIVWKTAIGSAASWKIAHLAGSTHPYLAPITLILCLQSTLNQSIHFAVHRVFGTALGIFITVLLAHYFSVNYLTIGLLIFIGTAVGAIFKTSYLFIHQIALSILLVFTFAHTSPDYGIDRLRDTLIGALIAFALAIFIFPIDISKKAKKDFTFYLDELIANFSATAQWVASGCPYDTGNRLHKGTEQLLKDLHQLGMDIEKAIKNLHLNPYSKKRREQLAYYNEQLIHLRQGYTHISGMLRTLMEWSISGTMTPYDYSLWSSYIFSLSAYISEWKGVLEQNEATGSQLPFNIATPSGMATSRYTFSLYNDAMEMLVDFFPPLKQPPVSTEV